MSSAIVLFALMLLLLQEVGEKVRAEVNGTPNESKNDDETEKKVLLREKLPPPPVKVKSEVMMLMLPIYIHIHFYNWSVSVLSAVRLR